MRLIDAEKLELDAEWSEYEDGYISYSQIQIDTAPTIEVSEELPKDIVEPIGKNVIMSEETYNELIEQSVSEDAISREYINRELDELSETFDKRLLDIGTIIAIREIIQDAPSVVPSNRVDELLEQADSLITFEKDLLAENQLQSYKDWVDLEDSEIIAECVHRYGGKAVVDACREYIEGADDIPPMDEYYKDHEEFYDKRAEE